MVKRLTDIVLALIALVLFSPVLLAVALVVKTGSRGPLIYSQVRIGKGMRPFRIYKFRTMYEGVSDGISLTVGDSDSRLTPEGRVMKKYKLDELPQLINVLKGDMSIVGPRPEVEKYVGKYSVEQKRVFSVKPGITDRASVKYRNESSLLALAEDPEEYYVKVIMPDKLEMNLRYVREQSFMEDVRIICATVKAVVAERKGIVK